MAVLYATSRYVLNVNNMKKIVIVLSIFFNLAIANAQIKTGDALPIVTLNNDKDVAITLESFKGRVVLVDFWASWCAPCRQANKKLAPFYNSHKNDNFEIVGISLDTNKTKWIAAIEKDKLAYPQLIDANGFDAKTALLFGVEQLPSSYLFDVAGKLIAVNPAEEIILNFLQQ